MYVCKRDECDSMVWVGLGWGGLGCINHRMRQSLFGFAPNVDAVDFFRY